MPTATIRHLQQLALTNPAATAGGALAMVQTRDATLALSLNR